MKSNVSSLHIIHDYIVNKMKTSFDIIDTECNIQKIQPHYFIGNNIPIKESGKLKITHHLKYQCTGCEKFVKKIYSGFCYICLTQKSEADTCIMSPHRCHYLQGTCREPQFGESFCYQPHYIYLSFTDKYKIGLTRHNQIPTRWIDQGATLASPFLKVYSRHQAGVVEKFLTQKCADRSHWKNMLKMQNEHPTIEAFRAELNLLKEWVNNHEMWKSHTLYVDSPKYLNIEKKIEFLSDAKIFEIIYPFSSELPQTIQSIKLDKTQIIEGAVIGVKGQYIILNNGNVINLRNHTGFVVDIECNG